MSPQVARLLSLIPPNQQDEFIRRLPFQEARVVIFGLEPDVLTFCSLAEAVQQRLEAGQATGG